MKRSILIVDDIPANLQLLSELLKTRGYKVRPVPNGRLALKAAENNPPDLILLDIMMPEMDGLQVLERLRQNEATKHIPVIMFTAKVSRTDIDKALKFGACDYITKPLVPDEFFDKIEKHISGE